jgi:hypothetical protein
MVSSKTNQRIIQFAIAALFVGAIALLLKIALTVLGEIYVYSIPILGGLLQSIELIELSNLIVFAILGFGLGVATAFLPARLRQRWGAIALVILTPIVLTSGYMTRHHMWVRQVAQQAEISVEQAQDVTDVFLQAEANYGGTLGYFLYTVKVPLLPTVAQEMKELTASERRMQSELSSMSGMQSGLLDMVFNAVGWGIRGFYIFIALMTVFIYFYKGMGRVQAARRPPQQMSVQP